MRRPAASGIACGVLLALSAHGAFAVELPTRKPGLWEMKMARTGSQMPDMTMQHCTDATIDKEMNSNVAPMAKQMCSKQDLQQTANGYVADFVCTIGGINSTGHTEIVGDFNSAYVVKTTSHFEGGKAGAPARDTTMTIEAKWLGACKPDQKPGDIVMPGGMKMNVKDMEKLKALLPGAKQ
ncbi:DUF3617 domain-containing protein [Bradyrhizobium sp. STM 3557]|uniref:DUF3617 domain-containing protein n=1 Tax=Bradyrhizobium sp. STM 3557 TaxID=578920 RepID=UPI00388D22CF